MTPVSPIYRRPVAHLRDLRERAYRQAGRLERQTRQAEELLSEDLREALHDPRVGLVLAHRETLLLNYAARVLLDWTLGLGLPPRLFDRAMSEVEAFEYAEPVLTTPNLDVQHTVQQIERLRRDERYSIYNLAARKYTEDVLHHWLRCWSYVEQGRMEDEELNAVYCDLTSAIDQLPPAEREVVDLFREGYTLTEISTRLKTDCRRRLQSAKRRLARILLEPNEEEIRDGSRPPTAGNNPGRN